MFFPKMLLATVVIMATIQTTPVLAHGEEHSHGSKGHAKPVVFKTMSADYLAIQTSLAGDSLKKANSHAEAIARAAIELSEEFDVASAGIDEKDTAAMLKILPEISETAAKFSEAKDIAEARKLFGPLSSAMISYRNLIVDDDVPNVAYCPRVKQSWLQNGKKIANPYYGAKMLRCGEIVSQ